MAEGRSSLATREPGVNTVTETIIEDEATPHLVLRLKKPKSDKKVSWTTETIDNEMMNKKKSKCCCIYEKPKLFGESSDEDDDDDCTNHCRGHKKKCYRPAPDGEGPSDSHSNPSKDS